MVSLWIAFATTLNHSLRWLVNRPVAAALCGAIGGPLAYLAGAKLGALTIGAPLPAIALIAVLWAPRWESCRSSPLVRTGARRRRVPA